MVALAQTVFSQDIQKNNTAILLIEFQKTWTEKGIFRKIIKKEYEERNVLNNTKNWRNRQKGGYKALYSAYLLALKQIKGYE